MHPSPPAPRRTFRRAGAAATLTAMLLTGCVGADWNLLGLEVTADEIGFQIGEPVVGEVIAPEGEITVTLAPAPVDPRRPFRESPRKRRANVVSCDYSPDTRRYSCPTEGLAQGRYVVRVSDAGMPSEGTQSVRVAVHEAPGYNPAAGQVPYEVPTEEGGDGKTFEREATVFADAGKPARVPLTGWAPRTTVRVSVRADGGEELHRTTVDIGPDGTATLRLPPFRAARWSRILLTDGVWVADLPFLVERD
jgi:hypothetical protein